MKPLGIEYELAAHGAWNPFNQQYEPTWIVFVRNASDVQTAMKAIYAADSHDAVQSGRHGAMKGWKYHPGWCAD